MEDFRPIGRHIGFLMAPSVYEWLPHKHRARLGMGTFVKPEVRMMIGTDVRLGRGIAGRKYIVRHHGLCLGHWVFSSPKLERATH
jgi:hypothetical protein